MFTSHCILWLAVCVLVVGSQNFDPNFPDRKTWWAKRVTDSLFVAGRLSETQIKYSYENGFRSLVSVFNNPETGKFGIETLPATTDSKYIAEELSDLNFAVLCPNEDNDGDDEGPGCWRRVQAIRDFQTLFNSLPKPALVYSNYGYSAAFVAIASLVSNSRRLKVKNAEEVFDAEAFYQRATDLGYDFSLAEDLGNVIYNISGGQEVRCPVRPDLTIPDWYKTYWWAKPVERNWYVAGQIQTDHLDILKSFGAEVVLNDRQGPSWTDPETGEKRLSQEEITLLNVNERCSTYCEGGRQSLENLLEHRIDPEKPSEYISPESPEGVNYQTRNYLEFGDDIGYNETVEQITFQQQNELLYYHTPMGGPVGYNREMYELYKEIFFEAHLNGDVLAHCRTGFRGILSAILTVGQALAKDAEWAITKARAVGYNFTEEGNSDIFDLIDYVFSRK